MIVMKEMGKRGVKMVERGQDVGLGRILGDEMGGVHEILELGELLIKWVQIMHEGLKVLPRNFHRMYQVFDFFNYDLTTYSC